MFYENGKDATISSSEVDTKAGFYLQKGQLRFTDEGEYSFKLFNSLTEELDETEVAFVFENAKLAASKDDKDPNTELKIDTTMEKGGITHEATFTVGAGKTLTLKSETESRASTSSNSMPASHFWSSMKPKS